MIISPNPSLEKRGMKESPIFVKTYNYTKGLLEQAGTAPIFHKNLTTHRDITFGVY
jgi:hypothetical protein